ncbi:MAG TPA: pitrilysin family protein [Prolixibacteraceae bacterium]|nr:pitrilysin family protein [Prolixibacteraceae bacterium]
MIEFQKYTLKNGLRVIVHPDRSTPLAAVNVIYNVGSKDENPEKTGFAHLFEHLMFGGSKNIPDYDLPLQKVGGESNAFTSCDITNYYETLPAENIEMAFWLESDRMLELAFSKKSLEIQRSVVIEEFRQRYLNQPYGDSQALLHELAYTVHPYRWPTIGKDISHIRNATLADVKDFFYSHYAPNNAVLTVAGNVDPDHVLKLAEKWFGEIPARNVPLRNLPVEPEQTSYRELKVQRDVSFDALYMAFHMDRKLTPNYYTTDLISDILSNGNSSRLYRHLVVEQGLFGELDAFISGDDDPGLFLVSGKLIPGVSYEQAESAIWNELERFKQEKVVEIELQKVINKVEANLIFSEINFLNKAMALASYELLGDASLINSQGDRYRQVTPQRLYDVANQIFRRENCSTLYYQKK